MDFSIPGIFACPNFTKDARWSVVPLVRVEFLSKQHGLINFVDTHQPEVFLHATGCMLQDAAVGDDRPIANSWYH